MNEQTAINSNNANQEEGNKVSVPTPGAAMPGVEQQQQQQQHAQQQQQQQQSAPMASLASAAQNFPAATAMLQEGVSTVTDPQQPQGTLDVSNEIKRLLQLHQATTAASAAATDLGQQAPSSYTNPPSSWMQMVTAAAEPTTPSNSNSNSTSLISAAARLEPQQHALPADCSLTNTNAFLPSLFDQKVQSPRFENSLGQALLGSSAAAGAGLTNPVMMGQAAGGGLFLQGAGLWMAQNQLLQNAAMNAQVLAAQQQAQQQQHATALAQQQEFSLFNQHGMIPPSKGGGKIEPFPEKLHRLLLEVEAAGRTDVISFVASGRAFAIHKPETFFKEIVPLYFRQSRLSSFKRQLNLYGFELVNTAGPGRGGYYHELFQRDHPELCRRMRRVAVKGSSSKPSPSDDVVKDPYKEKEVKEDQGNARDDKGV